MAAAPCLVLTPFGEPVSRDGSLLGVRAPHARIGDLVSDFDVLDALGDGDDGAAALHAEGHGQIGLVGPGAEVDVDVIESGGVDLEERLARLQGGLGCVLVAQGLGTSWSVHANGFHRGTSSR